MGQPQRNPGISDQEILRLFRQFFSEVGEVYSTDALADMLQVLSDILLLAQEGDNYDVLMKVADLLHENGAGARGGPDKARLGEAGKRRRVS